MATASLAPLPEQTRDMWRLQGQLIELFEERDSIAERLQTARACSAQPEGSAIDVAAIQAELDAINSGIAAFVVAKVQSVDEIRRPLLAMRDAAVTCREEAKRAENAALEWDRKIEAIEKLITVAMKTLDESGYWKPKETRKLVSPLGSFTLQNNGGKQPVEITDESLLPDDVCHAEVRMPFHVWKLVRMHLERGRHGKTAEELFGLTVKRLPSLTRVGEALVKPCGECGGSGENPSMDAALFALSHDATDEEHMQTLRCSACGGSGTAGVPGARLGDRGSHLRVK